MTALLIDELMPDHDSSVLSTRVWDEPPALSLRAGTELDLLPNPIMSTFGIVRPVPLQGRRRRPIRFADLLVPPLNWAVLAEQPGREIVAGQIRPLRLGQAAEPVPPWAEAAQFLEFSTPGYAKVAISLRAHPCGASTSILTLETRVALTDPRSRRQLRRSRLFAGYLRIRHGRRTVLAGEGSASP